MTFVVLFILAVVWAVYLVSWLRSRTETRGVDSISSFSRHLSILERTGPGARSGGFARRSPRPTALPGSPVVRRPTLSAAKKRRKDILTGLLAFTGVSALAALVAGGTFRMLFVLALVLTGTYVALLASAQKRVQERRHKVRYLATPAGPRPVSATPGVARPAAWTHDAAAEQWYGEDAEAGYGYGYRYADASS